MIQDLLFIVIGLVVIVGAKKIGPRMAEPRFIPQWQRRILLSPHYHLVMKFMGAIFAIAGIFGAMADWQK